MSTTSDVGAGPPRDQVPPGASLHASDVERTETVERLHQALGAGRLDLAETDERVTTAYAARYRHELTALLTDLPTTDLPTTGVPAGRAPSWTALWTLAVWRARTSLTGTATQRPTSRQLRTAALLVALTVVWVAACAVVGAAVVGA